MSANFFSFHRQQEGFPQGSYRYNPSDFKASPVKNNHLLNPSHRSVAETFVDQQQQLPELPVFELNQDGGSKLHTISIRSLYRYVLDCITNVGPVVSASQQTPMPTQDNLPSGEVVNENPPKSQKLQRRAVSVSGVFRSSQHPHITYRERLGGYLHPRDMRRLVTPFSTTNEPELIVRRHVMLLNFDPLRAILLRDRVLVLVPDGADSILVRLERRVRGISSSRLEDTYFGEFDGTTVDDKEELLAATTRNELANSISMSKQNVNAGLTKGDNNKTQVEQDENDNEWSEMEAREWAQAPFELQCADAVLRVVCDMLTEDTLHLERMARKKIDDILCARQNDDLTTIRDVKDAVQLMSARVKSFVQSMHRILNEDEDMALMNLSRLLTHPERFIQPVTREILEEESDEPEIILESNLQVGLTLLNYLDLIQGQVQTAKELVDQKQDQVRNRLLLANITLNVLMLCVTVMSVVSGFYGMNVPNGREEDPTKFLEIIFSSLAGSISLCIFIMGVLVYSGTFQRSSGGGGGTAVDISD